MRSAVELYKAYGFLYREYLKRSYLNENKGKAFFHFHALLPRTWTFVATNRTGDIGGTITLIPDDADFGLPLDKVYPDELAKLRNAGRKIGEVGMLAIDKSFFPRRSFSLNQFFEMQFLFHLFRTMFLCASKKLKLDDLVIMIHPKHIPIYRYLYFTQHGEARTYQSVNYAPAVFMRMDIARAFQLAGKDNYPLYHFFTRGKHTAVPLDLKYSLTLKDLSWFLSSEDAETQLSPSERKTLLALYGSSPSVLVA